MFGAILKVTNSSFQKGMTFCGSIYVKKVMKLLAFIFEQPSYMTNSVDPDQTAPIGAVCSGSSLFAFVLNLSVMLGSYMQQTTFADAFFSWRFKG